MNLMKPYNFHIWFVKKAMNILKAKLSYEFGKTVSLKVIQRQELQDPFDPVEMNISCVQDFCLYN